MLSKTEYAYILRWAKHLWCYRRLGNQCLKCGEKRFYCLEFHHLKGQAKENEINNLWTRAWSILEAEIDKCTLLCSRCHRIEHVSNSATKDFKKVVNKKICLEYKGKPRCEKCAWEENMAALHFHHEGDKVFDISDICIRLTSVKDLPSIIGIELDKCSILCANCHRERHFDLNKFKNHRKAILHRMDSHRNKRSIDPSTVAELVRQGKGCCQIAKELGVNKTSISYVISKRLLHL